MGDQLVENGIVNNTGLSRLLAHLHYYQIFFFFYVMFIF